MKYRETHLISTEIVEAIEKLAEQTGESVTEFANTLLNEALELRFSGEGG